MKPQTFIPLENCIPRHVYRLDSRNLALGVFDGKNGFIGIRRKFDNEFLDTEFHYDTGAPYGTACPLVDIGEIPDELEPVSNLGMIDEVTGRGVRYDDSASNPHGFNVTGWWVFTDTGEDCPLIPESRAMMLGNKALFSWLKRLNETIEA